MAAPTSVPPASPARRPDHGVVTPGRRAARESTTTEVAKPSLRERLAGTNASASSAVDPPFPAIGYVRLTLTVLLTVLCVLTLGGALLMVMTWRQETSQGALTSKQSTRLWDAWDLLADIERLVAFACVPAAMAWAALAALNVRRATARRRSAVVAALAVPVGAAGAWAVGKWIVAEATDWVGTASGVVLQAIFVAIPLLAFERVADAAEARHRPLRVAYFAAVAYLGVLQTLGGLSMLDRTSELDGWGRTAAYVTIATLIQAVGVLAAGEAARAIEEGTQNRYELRSRFSESVLAQAGL